jgi:zinc protease
MNQTSKGENLPENGTIEKGRTGAATTVVSTLENGLTVILRESRGNPTVSMQGTIPTGRIDDPTALPGLTHFAVDMLSAGTETRDKFQLAELFEDNGIELGFSAGRETFSFSGRSLSEDLPTMLHGLQEMLLRSTFPEAEVDKTRQQILSDLMESMHSTRAESAVAARKLLYGEANPFAGRISGDVENVKAITRDDLLGWFTRFSLDGAIFTLIGDFDAAAALDAVQSHFGDFIRPAVDRSGLLDQGAEFRQVAAQRQHVNVPEKSNFSLVWIGPGPAKSDPNWPAFFVANFIFGGDFYSRLNERLRVKEGLTYGSSSRFVNGLAHGPLMVTAQVSPAKMEQAIASATEEMATFAAEGPTADEMDLARSYLIGNFPVQLSTNSALAAVLTDCLYLGRGIDYIERYKDIISAVTIEQVREAARWYDPARLALVSAGSMATGTQG